MTEILKDEEGLNFREIYKRIVERNLYTLRAKKPDQVVNSEIRCHCDGINFPSASPVKYFKVIGQKDGKNLYGIFDENSIEESSSAPTKKVKVSSEDDWLYEKNLSHVFVLQIES